MVERGTEFGGLFIIIFSNFIVVALIHPVNPISGSRDLVLYGELPLHIPRRWYAKGEVTEEESSKKKNILAKKL